MMADKSTNTRRVPDFLLSWDRLGFRLLVFGSLALAWILQGGLADLSWQDLIRTEVGGLMPWAFLAPMVLSLDRRIQSARPDAWRFLAAHLAAMVVVFVPYWLTLRTISLIWKCTVSGWKVSQLVAFVPTTMNLLGAFLAVPFVYFLILLGSAAMKHAQARPEHTPRVFRLQTHEGYFAGDRIAISADGKELYYTEVTTTWTDYNIRYYKYSDEKWNGPFDLFSGFLGPALFQGE